MRPTVPRHAPEGRVGEIEQRRLATVFRCVTYIPGIAAAIQVLGIDEVVAIASTGRLDPEQQRAGDCV
jgi:hypothetical protein